MTPALLAGLLTAAAGGSLVLSLLCTVAARHTALRVGFIDRPGGHKSHQQPRPYGGGTAIFAASFVPLIAVAVAAFLAPQAWVAEHFGETVRAYVGGMHDQAGTMVVIMLGALAVHLIGLIDDVRPLGPYLKLLVLLIVGLLVAWVGDVRLAEFAGRLPATLLTAVWLVVIINAFNFLDNMDGLSAGVACVAMAFLVVCGLLSGQVLVPALGCVFLGAIAGFLFFNFPPARIFMGDAGSLLVGYMLAVLSVRTTYYESGSGAPPYALLTPLVVLAVPLYDFVSVVIIRLAEGRNPMKGDQRHFSHRLVDRGLSRRAAVLTIYLATAATGLAATLLPGADLRGTITIGVLVLMVLAIVAILEAPLRSD